ncbi:MAG: hypothetical protein F9K32_13010 [Desulfobulbaceae bacterium]|nr:MAG: hypothetical protein F9K32_13010 [Desulfobulbaceae bacterium]
MARSAGIGRMRRQGNKPTVLQGESPAWTETDVLNMNARMDDKTIFDNLDLGDTWFPNGLVAKDNILGFTQQADDNLGVIAFTHTFQIPSLR